MYKKLLYVVLGALLAAPLFASALSTVTTVGQGGTGSSLLPSFGQILVGNSSHTYTPTATSSLGLPTFNGSNTFSGANSFATTTTSVLNGVIVVDGVRYAYTAAGINAAICAAIPRSGTTGTVYIPAGTVTLSASINYRCNNTNTGVHLKLIGAGMDVTTLTLGNNVASDPAIRAVLQGYTQQQTQSLNLYANASSSLEVSDMTIDYNGQNQNVDAVVVGILGDNTFASSYIHNTKIKNVVVPSFNPGIPSYGLGIDMYDARNAHVENNQFFNNDVGIWVTSYANEQDVSSVFSNNFIASSTYCIDDESGAGVTIAYNYMSNCSVGIFGPTLIAGDQQSLIYNTFSTSTVPLPLDISSTASVAQIFQPVGRKGFAIPTRDALFFNTSDLNWRIGKVDAFTDNFTEATNTTSIELTTGSASTDGFSIGTEQGNSIAEFEGSTGNVYFRNNIGLGTTSPFAQLSVVGNTFITGGATTSNLAITGISSSLLKTLSSGAVVAAVPGTDYLTSAAAYPFGLSGNATSTLTQFNGGLTAFASSTMGNGTQANGLTISGGATTTGNAYFANKIGIGSMAPGAALEISGSGTNSGQLRLGTGSNAWELDRDNVTTGRLKITTTSGTEALSLLGTGNVGIGTTSPYTSLAVAGSTGVLANYFTATSTTASILAGGIGIASAKAFNFNTNDANWRIGKSIGAFTKAINTSGIDLATGNGTNDGFSIGTNTGNSIVEFMGATGNTYFRNSVGIGTSSPFSALHVTSGASATTTITIGSIGLTSSKGCVNMNAADGSASSFYISAAHTIVVEANYCR